jgi:hypothetical protein
VHTRLISLTSIYDEWMSQDLLQSKSTGPYFIIELPKMSGLIKYGDK